MNINGGPNNGSRSGVENQYSQIGNNSTQFINDSLNNGHILKKAGGAGNTSHHLNQGMPNKRSISGASNKHQFNFNALKGHSSTPKNQNLTSGFNFRSNNAGGAAQYGNQRIPQQLNSRTQVIKDHLPQDLRTGAHYGSMPHQRLYMAQQKLAKQQLRVNTNNEPYLRYG
mmetsp:Transcript_10354/g.15903  ORF Transcript_10354/g.15903 Transcript_10354/m.15903 type:complete len:170 (-) Transcript_10354:1596-2105(-)